MLVPILMSGTGSPCDSARGARGATSSSRGILRPGPPSGPRWEGSIIRRCALRRNPTRPRSRRWIRGTWPCTHLVGKRVETSDRGSRGATITGPVPTVGHTRQGVKGSDDRGSRSATIIDPITTPGGASSPPLLSPSSSVVAAAAARCRVSRVVRVSDVVVLARSRRPLVQRRHGMRPCLFGGSWTVRPG